MEKYSNWFKMVPLVSVIIPTYNRAGQLKDCLDSLFNQTYKKFEVMVVDDGSTDGTENLVRVLQKKHKYLKYLKQKNKGPAAARNLGVQKSKGGILAFTDDDCVVDKTWISSILKYFKNTSKNNILGGVSEYMPTAPGKVLQYLLEISMKDKEEIIFFATNNVCFHKLVIQKIGFFDENFKFAAGEDTDFFWRAYKAGFKFILNSKMKIEHRHSVGFIDFLKKSYYYGRGNYQTKTKCLDHPKLKDIEIRNSIRFYFQVFKNLLNAFNFSYNSRRYLKERNLVPVFLLFVFVYAYNLGLIRQKISIQS